MTEGQEKSILYWHNLIVDAQRGLIDSFEGDLANCLGRSEIAPAGGKKFRIAKTNSDSHSGFHSYGPSY